MQATDSVRAMGFGILFLLAILFLAPTAGANPDIQHWLTGNGARVYFVPAPELPMVDIQVTFDAGSARDGDLAGLAMFTNGMLEEGAGKLDANAIAERFNNLGARFSADSQRDMAFTSLRSLTKPDLLEPAVDTLALLLSRPSFPPDALERVRQQMLTGLQYQEQNPGELASLAFYHALYGEHPYGIPSSGTRESVHAITRKDLQDFYQRYYVGRNAVVAIVGAVSRDQAEHLAEAAVGGLAEGAAAPALPAVPPLTQARQQHIDHPSSQTHLLVGQPGKRRGDEDYFPLYVGNHILGGSGLVSRISDEVREKRGLAYSAYSYFVPMRLEGPFILGLQTANNNRDEALQVLRQTLIRFVEEGPTDEELMAAKKNITGGFPLKIDSNSDILGYISMIGFYGLPLDYLDTFNSRVDALTTSQIRDAFARRIHPDKMITITVGGKS